jgi:hypothetical protein
MYTDPKAGLLHHPAVRLAGGVEGVCLNLWIQTEVNLNKNMRPKQGQGIIDHGF